MSVTQVQTVAGEDERFTGVIRARIETTLGFRVGGKIAERLVDPGQMVRRGQVLMRLDPADLALDAKAQAANVAAARARSVQAESDLRRLQGMVEAGAISAQAMDQAKASADTARAQVLAAEAQDKVAQNARGYAVLIADSDGVVQDILAEPGQVVATGQSVVRLAHAGPREAAVDLPETVRPALGSLARASLYGRGGPGVPARLRQLSQSADPASRTFEARYVLEGAGDSAPLGATVTVSLSGGARGGPGEASVPLGALYDPGPGPGVWLVRGDRVIFQPVKVTTLGSETAQVTGLSPRARIVALGADHLRNGQPVRSAALPGVTGSTERTQ